MNSLLPVSGLLLIAQAEKLRLEHVSNSGALDLNMKVVELEDFRLISHLCGRFS